MNKLNKPNAAVRAYQFSKLEIERVVELPLDVLSRREASVRRLLEKYHDNAQLLRAKPTSKHSSVGALFGHNKVSVCFIITHIIYREISSERKGKKESEKVYTFSGI